MRDDSMTANIRCAEFGGVSIGADDKCWNVVDPCSIAVKYVASDTKTQKGEISLASGIHITARLSHYNIVNDALAEMMPREQVSDDNHESSNAPSCLNMEAGNNGVASETKSDTGLAPADVSSPLVGDDTEIPSAEEAASEVRFEILLGPINVSVINDLGRGDVPLMRVALHSPKRLVYGVRRLTPLIVQTRVQCSLSIALDYFNVPLSTWEPLLEMWTARMKICMPRVKRHHLRRGRYHDSDQTLLKKGDVEPEDDLEVVANTYLKIKAPHTLNVNVSQVCLNSIFETTALLGEMFADGESVLIPQKSGD